MAGWKFVGLWVVDSAGLGSHYSALFHSEKTESEKRKE
jgi:hypothetical protein